MKLLSLFFASILCASAGEYAVLATGFRIHADTHESSGSLVRLHTREGVIEVLSANILAFETEEYTPPPPPDPAPAPAPRSNAPPPRGLTPKEMVSQAADKAGIPRALVHSVAKAESAYQPKALSPKGAIGIMQLMPGTAAALHADPNDPQQNTEAGAQYLRDLLLKYQDDPHQVSKALAAYNAGPGAVDKYNGVPPYRETVNYVNRVIRQYEKNEIGQ